MTLKERILTKPGYKFLFLILLGFTLLEILSYMDNKELNNIKNNPNIIVQCNIKGKGWVDINKSKIISFDDDGTFIFTDGYARSCVIIHQ